MVDEKDVERTDPETELKAMGDVAKAVGGLDDEARARVLRWAIERYGVIVAASSGRGKTGGTGSASSENGSNGNGSTVQQFAELADLYAATSPESDADKTLVTGYWFQFGEGKPELNSQEINNALKNLGHPIKNITSAFDTLKARKPAPVMQLKKSGTSKQARKTYKLTVAGKQAVELMIGQH